MCNLLFFFFVFLQYGLYSAFAGCIVYTVFGSCKDITIGPTALMSLMTYRQVANRNSDYAVLLCFLSGILQFIMGSLKLGTYICIYIYINRINLNSDLNKIVYVKKSVVQRFLLVTRRNMPPSGFAGMVFGFSLIGNFMVFDNDTS